MNKRYLSLNTLISFLFLLPLSPLLVQASPPGGGNIILYTPYVSRSVTPGDNLVYNLKVINKSSHIENVHFSYEGIPRSWKPKLSESSQTFQRIAVEPKSLSKNNSKEINLNLNIPLKIKKGYYNIKVIAETDDHSTYALPLRVKVTKQGTFTTKMKVQQANMEGYADSDFNYQFVLSNKTAEKQNYAFNAKSPPGWNVRFKVGGNYATSVSIGSNDSKTIYVKVKPSQKVKAGTYQIPIHAISGNTSNQDTLKTVINGRYDVQLSTPSGRLSTDVTAGSHKGISLRLKNTGSLPLNGITLSSTSPKGWDVSFASKKITELKAGESTPVKATIKVNKKAIAGDYQLKIMADTQNASSDASFRITVKRSMLWGGVGIIIILAVIGGIFMLVRTYGRR